jgi:tripartite ATP-independent transporter DctP family solute receptor
MNAIKWLAAVLALVVATSAPAVAAKTFKIATIALNGSPWHQSMLKFKEVVETESKGELQVVVYTDGQLGDISGLMTAMQLGTVEMSYMGAATLIQLKGAEALNIIYLPYLFKNAEQAERVQNNEEFKAIYEKVAQSAGVRLVGAWGQRSARALQTTKGPITRPEQVRGTRLRVPPILGLKATFETLGAQITPMGMLDIYNALSRGAIDGQDNGFDLSIPANFHEVAKYWSATDHVFELTAFIASERFWKGLSASERTIIEKAGRVAGDLTTELTKKFDAESIEKLKAAGVTYVVPDRAAFQSALSGIEKGFDGSIWPAGMADRIRKAQE